jgi:hypothetical protein
MKVTARLLAIADIPFLCRATTVLHGRLCRAFAAAVKLNGVSHARSKLSIIVARRAVSVI